MTEYEPIKLEDEISNFWKENNVKERVRESTEGNEPFFMIDGPPYLNGYPHVGHMQGKVLKDVMLRFKQMQGYDVWDQAGFDSHGLPVEVDTEEKLDIQNKSDIGEKISKEKFIRECKENATANYDIWKEVNDDYAIWQDFENAFITYKPDYIESEWWLVKKTYEKGLIEKAEKPMHWCPRCETTLSGYEVTDEYQDVEDLSVYVKFPLEGREEKLVIWTTTPWTIPANMAVFVNPKYQYAVVEAGGEKLIVAEQLVPEVLEQAGYEEDEYSIERTLVGSDLKGMKYEHPLMDEVPEQKELDEEDNVHTVQTSGRLVGLEDGTGLVHAATGHGQEDYEAARPLGLPVFSPVDEDGNFDERGGKYEGRNVHEVNQDIADDLEEKGLLLASNWFQHEYPHCWRCKSKLVLRATEQWFIRNEETKQMMLEENEEVNWVPDSAQQRFHNFVEDSPDWCISRQNYWGAPLPIWVNDETGEIEVIGSFKELEEKSGEELPEDFDPHPHVVDDIKWEGENGGTFERVPDVMDVWMDSGCAPFASMHYPFENKEMLEDMWPMDFITEGSDQIRGWFYHLMFCGVLGFEEKPYDTILFQGFVLDAEGEKMSKSLGNVVDPAEQKEKFGADLPRFYQLRLAPPWEQKNYNEAEIENEIYRLFSVYWNIKEFYKSYCPEETEKPDDSELQVEDRWILSRLNSIQGQAEERIDNGMFHKYTRSLEDFILEDFSRWYVKRIRPRVKRGDEAAEWTLEHTLKQINRMLAPFTPHFTEKVYQEIDGENLSVHMEKYPEEDEELVDEGLEEYMDLAREIVEKSSRIRDENQYNLRWPARRLVISTDKEVEEELEDFRQLIKEMANVKKIEFGDVASELQASPDYSKLGPKFGGNADEVAQKIEELEHDQIEELKEVGELELEEYQIEVEDVEISSSTSENLGGKSFEKGQLYLDLQMTEEIEEEAFVSEVLREIQQMRKEAELEVEDEVELSFSGDTEPLESHEDEIRSRVNLAGLDFSDEEHEYSGSVEFEGRKTRFSFSEPVNR
ncbi:MAG: isoleucine--tRNA ligase [Candidatus Nanohalobium sp.]